MTEMRLKTSSLLFYMAGILGILFALVYLLTPTIMPYHEQFIGKTQAQLDPRIRDLMLMALRIIGGAYMAISVGIIMLARKLSQDNLWVRWPMFVMGMISLSPSLWVTLKVGHSAPWWLVTLDMLLIAGAIIILRPSEGTVLSERAGRMRVPDNL